VARFARVRAPTSASTSACGQIEHRIVQAESAPRRVRIAAGHRPKQATSPPRASCDLLIANAGGRGSPRTGAFVAQPQGATSDRAYAQTLLQRAVPDPFGEICRSQRGLKRRGTSVRRAVELPYSAARLSSASELQHPECARQPTNLGRPRQVCEQRAIGDASWFNCSGIEHNFHELISTHARGLGHMIRKYPCK